jgi:Glycosyltransferase 61
MTDHSMPSVRSLRHPDLSDFVFFGFDGQMAKLQRNVQRVEIRTGMPGVSGIDDFIYVPMDQSGLLRREREALARGDIPHVPSDPAFTIDEEVVYLGWLFNHYGHFLMQSLSRVWFLAELEPSIKVVFHHSSAAWPRLADWTQRMLMAFGVPPERILILTAPTRLRRLIVPEPLFEPRSVADDQMVRVHEAMAQPYRDVAARVVNGVKSSAQPVYLSRRRLPSSQRRMIGEDQLEELLQQNGVRIAYPERMPFEEQVRLINSHADIISNAGSAAQNVLFALHKPRLHLLTNGAEFSPDYFMHATVVGTPTSFINGLGTGGRTNFPRARKQTPHLVDMPACAAYFEQRGLVTHSTLTWSTGHAADQQAQYDEAWLYGYVRNVGHRSRLPERIEQEALNLASRSWPVSLALARHYINLDTTRVEGMARQFVALAATEQDLDRLKRYQREVEEMVPIVARRCSSDTAVDLRDVLNNQFFVDRMRLE